MLLSFDIEKSVQWRLSHGSPPVRYLAHRDLLAASPDSSAMKTWKMIGLRTTSRG